MENNGIHIVDRGRGPQLSTCRITVQDVVPYIQRGFTSQQILEIMPVLTTAEIDAVQKYVRENYEAVMEQDRRIRERNAAKRQPPDAEEAERKAIRERLESARILIRQKKQEQSSDPASR
ncbi:MAG TPA: DUF433 domain-containing protein [Gemmataceae bacterium]|nr:DUF433 domain-containing protein [Gemmataceae bacterium]